MATLDNVNIAKTFGALLLGGLFATALSGMVQVQGIVYFRFFPKDPLSLKSSVGAVSLLDAFHTSFIWAALWEYLIKDAGQPVDIDAIYWSISLSVVVTALLTFIVHCFLALRIFLLSGRNWFLTAPIFGLAILRVISACATTSQMLRYESFILFGHHAEWLFTTGLALSTAVDIIISVSMSILLNSTGKDAPSMVPVLNRLIMYTFEAGFLTSAGTVISMFFWIFREQNGLIFLGLHFVIAKLYATSLLITLNGRRELGKTRGQRVWVTSAARPRVTDDNVEFAPSPTQRTPNTAKFDIEISVEHTVEYSSDDLPSSNSRPKPPT
ncbi:hypothetical protein DL96DRAFT_1615047 [Flagelloscypha sp. PMI_526]|nr:hypothetical protein DL96DRAFT_1615047 [Flagelloscypha sp. PMI_526]